MGNTVIVVEHEEEVLVYLHSTNKYYTINDIVFRPNVDELLLTVEEI